MNWTSGSLDGGVRVQVKVILKWMSDIMLNQSARNSVTEAITGDFITWFGKDSDVMTLRTDGHSPLNLFQVKIVRE